MSNIVAMALCRIQDNSKLEYNKDKGADKTFKLYSSMADILCESADRFVEGDWEFEIIENNVKNYQEIFDKNFGEVYEMWDGGKNNILFLDFDQLKDFQMFNYTDPKTLSGNDANNKYGLQHQHYLNAGVRYYPSSMSQNVWDLGWKYAKDWDYNIWGTEQIIFNEMMYSQDKDHTHWLDPTMNYQMMNATPDLLENANYITQLNAWNNTTLNEAKILHLHGTRGAEQTILTQWTLWEKLTGEQFEFEHIEIINGGVKYK